MTKRDGTNYVVQWPKSAVGTDDKDQDLGPPLNQLLIDVGVKGSSTDQRDAGRPIAAITGTPDSVAIIEAGATAASKGWATFLALFGGGAVVWAKLDGFWSSKSNGVQAALVGGLALVVAAVVVAIGLVMYGDVRARGQAAAAQYQARAIIAKAFLDTAPQAIRTNSQTNGHANFHAELDLHE